MARLRHLAPATFQSRTEELPDADGEVILGRAPGCGIRLEADSIRPRHARLWRDRGLWRLEGFGPDTTLNGARLQPSSLVQDGDLLQLGQEALTFEDRVELVPQALEEAVAAAPDDADRWRVWSDALQEAGDPLGEAVARAMGGVEASPDRWLDGLWREVGQGVLELEWRHGMIRRAVVRSNGRLEAQLWRLTLTRLLALRAARFLETLVVDAGALVGPEALSGVALQALGSALVAAAPRALRRLELGHHAGDGVPVTLPPGATERTPWLEPGPLFRWRAQPVVTVEQLSPGLRGPLTLGAQLPLRAPFHVRLRPAGLLVLETSGRNLPGGAGPRFTIEQHDGRSIVVGQGVTLNGRRVTYGVLLAGDRIGFDEQVTLRFGLA
ncbi:MAG: FHA domain-containing protein [Myxococcaceae bacterium]|nr:FHA domain-containing protein [Myxococcaceae bacterium]